MANITNEQFTNLINREFISHSSGTRAEAAATTANYLHSVRGQTIPQVIGRLKAANVAEYAALAAKIEKLGQPTLEEAKGKADQMYWNNSENAKENVGGVMRTFMGTFTETKVSTMQNILRDLAINFRREGQTDVAEAFTHLLNEISNI